MREPPEAFSHLACLRLDPRACRSRNPGIRNADNPVRIPDLRAGSMIEDPRDVGSSMRSVGRRLGRLCNMPLRPFQALAFLLGGILVLGPWGCASPSPDHLEISGAEYPAAFQAAEEATRRVGMPATLSDRTAGVIESSPRLAGSILEPWRIDHSTAEQWTTSTLHKQRRRVRFEFLPLDFAPVDPSGEEPLVGAPLPGSGEALSRSVDLDDFDGPIEVRVWVWIEREQGGELRRNTWSRRSRDFASDPLARDSVTDDTTRSSGRWTPVERDLGMERRLLAEVAAATARPSDGG